CSTVSWAIRGITRSQSSTATHHANDLDGITFLELCGWEIAVLYRLAVELDQNQLFCQLQRHQQIRNGCPRFDVPGLSVQVKLHTERIAESQSFQTGSRPFALSAAAISSGDR